MDISLVIEDVPLTTYLVNLEGSAFFGTGREVHFMLPSFHLILIDLYASLAVCLPHI